MMPSNNYNIIWDSAAFDDLHSLPRHVAKRIYDKVNNHLVKEPIQLGKPLQGKLKGYYRYRIGDYRIIYEVR